MTLSELRDKMNSVIGGTNFSLVYDLRDDGFETLILYEKSMSNAPKRPRMRTLKVGSIYKSKFESGWVDEDNPITDDTDEDADDTDMEDNEEVDEKIQTSVDSTEKVKTIGCYPYMYSINGIPCGTIDDGLSLFLEPLTKAGIKIPGISKSTDTRNMNVNVEMLKATIDAKVKIFIAAIFFTFGVILSLIGIFFPPILVGGIIFIIVGVLCLRAKIKASEK